MTTGIEETLHDVEDVARILKCSNKTVRRLIERGDLPAHRFGRLLRVSPDDLRRYIASHRGVQAERPKADVKTGQ